MSGGVDQGNHFFHLSCGPVVASFNDCAEFRLQMYPQRQGNQTLSLVLGAVTAAHSSSLLSYVLLFLLSVTLEAQP